jgi:hypothetical protein
MSVMTVLDRNRWPELDTVPASLRALLARAVGPHASETDWEELQGELAYQGKPQRGAYESVRYLIAHVDSAAPHAVAFVELAGVLAVGEPPASLREAWAESRPTLLGIARDVLGRAATPEEAGIVLAAIARLVGRPGAGDAIDGIAREVRTGELVVCCQDCRHEFVATPSELACGPVAHDPLVAIADATGQVAWARMLEGLAARSCSVCGAGLLDEPTPRGHDTILRPWAHLEAWGRSRPELWSRLGEAAAEQALVALERTVRMPLPPGPRAVYRGHDGECGMLGLVEGLPLLPITEVAALWGRGRARREPWASVGIPVAHDGRRVVVVLCREHAYEDPGTVVVFGGRPRAFLASAAGAPKRLARSLDAYVSEVGVRVRRGELELGAAGLRPAPPGPLTDDDEEVAILGLCVQDYLEEGRAVHWPGLGVLSSVDASTIVVEKGAGSLTWIDEVAAAFRMERGLLYKAATAAALVVRNELELRGQCRLPKLGMVSRRGESVCIERTVAGVR